MIKSEGAVGSATMFVLPKQPTREVWTGTRIGVDGIGMLTGIRGRSSADLYPVLDSLAGTGAAFSVAGDVGAHGTDDDSTVTLPPSPHDHIFARLHPQHPSLTP